MTSPAEIESARRRSVEVLESAGIILLPEEQARIEVVDFALGNLMETGLQLFTYVNTTRCCAKELVLFPGQTCAEHRHPPVGDDPGKEETFRCRQGTVFLFVDGYFGDVEGAPPAGVYTVKTGMRLEVGTQFTIPPDTLHWFQAGPEGAIITEFSTRSTDEFDVFTDPRIIRVPSEVR